MTQKCAPMDQESESENWEVFTFQSLYRKQLDWNRDPNEYFWSKQQQQTKHTFHRHTSSQLPSLVGSVSFHFSIEIHTVFKSSLWVERVYSYLRCVRVCEIASHSRSHNIKRQFHTHTHWNREKLAIRQMWTKKRNKKIEFFILSKIFVYLHPIWTEVNGTLTKWPNIFFLFLDLKILNFHKIPF